jgi:NADPH-dependent 2,4-dienoyl-CoA reductase/sulfur reductase-like enzyme
MVRADIRVYPITAEDYPPYNRPPLSKGLWEGEPIETIWRGTAELGVELHRGRRVRHVDLHVKQVTDDNGQVYAFDRAEGMRKLYLVNLYSSTKRVGDGNFEPKTSWYVKTDNF